MSRATPLLVLGSTGAIGRVLRALWPVLMRGGLMPLWQARVTSREALGWDILAHDCPEVAASGVVLCLAGGRVEPGVNAELALAALQAAADQGGRHVFLASSAAVYAPGEGLAEDAPTEPPSDYGREKLAMERAALDWAARNPGGPGLTLLRIGNIAGLDALLGRRRQAGPVVLDPVPGYARGPVRSYIGPQVLATTLAGLAVRAAAGEALPQVLNLAAPRPVAMADLLDAAGMEWSWGPPAPQAIGAVTLDTTALQGLVRMSPVASSPAGMVQEWRSLPPGAT